MQNREWLREFVKSIRGESETTQMKEKRGRQAYKGEEKKTTGQQRREKKLRVTFRRSGYPIVQRKKPEIISGRGIL